jgi:hypothetical protein
MGDLRDDCTVGLAFFLAFVAEVLVEHLVAKPLDAAAPSMPRWWLIYVSLAVGAALGWFFEVNVFAMLTIPAIVGRVVTVLLIGGGTQERLREPGLCWHQLRQWQFLGHQRQPHGQQLTHRRLAQHLQYCRPHVSREPLQALQGEGRRMP